MGLPLLCDEKIMKLKQKTIFYCTNKRYDCAPKAVDQHVRKTSCAALDEELVEFVGAGVEEDDGEGGEKMAFHV